MNNSGIKPDSNGQGNMNNNNNNNSINNNIPQATNNRANLIVNYLPQSLKEHDFNQLFSKIGPLKACKLMFDRTTGNDQYKLIYNPKFAEKMCPFWQQCCRPKIGPNLVK